LSLDALRSHVAAEKIDTVVVAITDRQGRLQGNRMDASSSWTKWPNTARTAATT
jgi:hypothetical protein